MNFSSAMSDIAFLLLLFFLILAMATTASSLPIAPPHSLASSESEDHTLILTVDSSGNLFYEQVSISVDEIHFSESVTLLADKETPYGSIDKVIQQLKSSGVKTLHCIVEPYSE